MEISKFISNKKKDSLNLGDNEIIDIFEGKTKFENIKLDTEINTVDENLSSIIISEKELLEYKNILQKSFELFEFRGGYDCEDFLKQFRDQNSFLNKNFYKTIINSLSGNPLGLNFINIAQQFKTVTKITEYKDIFFFGLSYLIQNKSNNYTAVIFIPSSKGSGQISIVVSRLIIGVIFKLYYILKIPIDEILIIHSKSFYPDGTKLLSSLHKNFFLQFFSNIEILSPVINNIFTPQITILSKEQEEEFFKTHIYLKKDKLRKLELSKEPLLKYYGIKSQTLIKINRINIYEDTTGVDQTYSYIF